MDVEISAEEYRCVLNAQSYMAAFAPRTISALCCPNRVIPFEFTANPQVTYAENEGPVKVAAAVEMLGLAFTQGVNEMQTLANLSSSRDCLKQGEINNATLARLRTFFQGYRAALLFQLDSNRHKMADFIQTMNNNQPNITTMNPRNTMSQFRNRSMRNSIYIGANNANASNPNATGSIAKEMVDRKVEQFVTKVLQYNDRYELMQFLLCFCF